MPKISCIMPVYNTAEYLEECIESILNQSFTDFEFIISDDWSTDWSKEIIKEYAKKDKRIVFLDNKKNRWICANLNDCVSIAKWEYIAIMESDDISYKDRFKIQINEFQKDNSIDLIWASAEYINKNWKIIIPKITGILGNIEINKTFLKTIWIITPSFMIKRNSLIQNWIFEYSEIWDYELYVKMVLKNMKIKNIENILIKKRIHNNSTYNKNWIKISKILFKFKKNIIKEYKLNSYFLIFIYCDFIKNYIISNIKYVLLKFNFYEKLYTKIR